MQFLFDTDGFALYELEERDCLHQEEEIRRPGQVLLFAKCVTPCLGYEIAVFKDANEAAAAAERIANKERGIGVGYIARASEAAIADADEKRKAVQRNRKSNGANTTRGITMTACKDERYLAALYVLNKEAKRLRDLRRSLVDFLFEKIDPSKELEAYLHAEGIPTRNEDGRPINLVDFDYEEAQAREACSVLSDVLGNTEGAEALDEMLDRITACREAISTMHELLSTMKDEQRSLYALKQQAVSTLGIPFVGYHKGAHGELYEYYRQDEYGFHCPTDLDESEIGPLPIMNSSPICDISSKVNESLSQGMTSIEAKDVILELVGE